MQYDLIFGLLIVHVHVEGFFQILVVRTNFEIIVFIYVNESYP